MGDSPFLCVSAPPRFSKCRLVLPPGQRGRRPSPHLPVVICEQLWQLRFVNNIKVTLIYIPAHGASGATRLKNTKLTKQSNSDLSETTLTLRLKEDMPNVREASEESEFCKAADPLEVFVPPAPLVLDVLVFFFSWQLSHCAFSLPDSRLNEMEYGHSVGTAHSPLRTGLARM